MDWDRATRTGVAEAVLADAKTDANLNSIVADARSRSARLLLTRLSPRRAEAFAADDFDYDPLSSTGMLGKPPAPDPCGALIVTAGTSDLGVAHEALRTLAFHGYAADVLADVGVAGLWRLMEHKQRLLEARVIIAVAGMEGALFPVLGGLVPGIVIAVPTSVGYGVSEGGKAALSTALATCSPGVVAVNIDNGFGAAATAIKILRG